jgi:hypothetical protein
MISILLLNSSYLDGRKKNHLNWTHSYLESFLHDILRSLKIEKGKQTFSKILFENELEIVVGQDTMLAIF